MISSNFLSYAPIIFVSAETKQRLNKLPEMIKRISESQNRRISSAVLNDVIMDAIAINPTPTDKGKRLKIFYGTQVSVKPPTFVIFVNEEELCTSHTCVSWKIKFVKPLVLREHQSI